MSTAFLNFVFCKILIFDNHHIYPIENKSEKLSDMEEDGEYHQLPYFIT